MIPATTKEMAVALAAPISPYAGINAKFRATLTSIFVCRHINWNHVIKVEVVEKLILRTLQAPHHRPVLLQNHRKMEYSLNLLPNCPTMWGHLTIRLNIRCQVAERASTRVVEKGSF